MSVLKTIDGIPLYSTLQEALAWAKRNGLEGAHVHKLNGGIGYMGGSSHSAATAATRTATPTTTQVTTGGGGSGGY